MSKFKNSYLLFKKSLTIMRNNKKLIIFPAIIMASTLFIILLIFAPVIFSQTSGSIMEAIDRIDILKKNHILSSSEMLYFSIIYFISIFTAAFFEVAFYNEILKAFNGEPVSIYRGIKSALKKIKLIFFWSLLAGIVGITIRKIEERFGFVGKIIIKLIGVTWSVASIFVIPFIVIEETNSNPINILKKSAETIKKTWGESLIFNGIQFSVLMIFSVIGIPIIILFNIPFLFIVYIGFFIIFANIIDTASQIYKCALFIYATQGTAPSQYNKELLDMAWKTKE